MGAAANWRDTYQCVACHHRVCVFERAATAVLGSEMVMPENSRIIISLLLTTE